MRHAPKLGIFYLLNGRIISETASFSAIKPSGAIRSYPRQHYEFWSELQKRDPDLYDLDCYSLPRGTVLYNLGKKTFEVIADLHILEKDNFVARIIYDFDLEKSDVEFKEHEDYRCSVCRMTSATFRVYPTDLRISDKGC